MTPRRREPDPAEPAGTRRPYDSPVRRQQAARTRERLIAAGAEVLHGVPIWNWSALTVRAVAERAGIHERTVYRYFPTERDLRDAVLQRLSQEAGVDIEGLRLDQLTDVTTRIFDFVSTFPVEPRTRPDPTVAAENERQRAALLDAVAPLTQDWPATDRRVAAGMLDVLWSVVSYERLVTDWQLRPEEAIRGITWAMRLLEEAVRHGPPPGRGGA